MTRWSKCWLHKSHDEVCHGSHHVLGALPSRRIKLEWISWRPRRKKGVFHYSWLLILIAMIGWREPTDSSFIPPIHGCCEAARYASLWHNSIKERQQDTNVCCGVYHMDIEMSLCSLLRISEEIVVKYGPIVAFSATMHHIYLCARLDRSWRWLTLPYHVDDVAINK